MPDLGGPSTDTITRTTRRQAAASSRPCEAQLDAAAASQNATSPPPDQQKTAARLSWSQIRAGSTSGHHEVHGQGGLADDLAPGPPPRHAST
jgi:hypothetical protein